MNLKRILASAVMATSAIAVAPAMAQVTPKLTNMEKSTLKIFNDLGSCIVKEAPKFEAKLKDPDFEKKIKESVENVIKERSQSDKATIAALKTNGLTEDEATKFLAGVTDGEKQGIANVLIYKQSPKFVCYKAAGLDTPEKKNAFAEAIDGLVKKYGPDILEKSAPPKQEIKPA